MKITNETNWTKKQWKSPISRKNSKKDWISNVSTNKKYTEHPETDVSVLTKTTNPKVIINTEDIKNGRNNLSWKKQNKYDILIFFCFIIMCIIILATFFISLQTHNIVKELSDYIIL